MKNLLTLALTLAITACSLTDDVEPVVVHEVTEKTVVEYHPPMPDPVTCTSPNYSIHPSINEYGEMYAVVGMEYDASVDFRKCQEETLSYIESLLIVVCYYRRDISDPLCGDMYEPKTEINSNSTRPRPE